MVIIRGHNNYILPLWCSGFDPTNGNMWYMLKTCDGKYIQTDNFHTYFNNLCSQFTCYASETMYGL